MKKIREFSVIPSMDIKDGRIAIFLGGNLNQQDNLVKEIPVIDKIMEYLNQGATTIYTIDRYRDPFQQSRLWQKDWP